MCATNAISMGGDDAIADIIRMYPLASLVGLDDGIVHVPIYRLADGVLYGHLGRRSVHAHQDAVSVTAVFTGPHAYVSPTYYHSRHNVPTWNYAAVHCRACLRFIETEEVVWSRLQEMVALSEGRHGWRLPRDPRYKSMMAGLRMFELSAPAFETRFKFNQGDSAADVDSIIRHLLDSDPAAGHFMAGIHSRMGARTLAALPADSTTGHGVVRESGQVDR